MHLIKQDSFLFPPSPTPSLRGKVMDWLTIQNVSIKTLKLKNNHQQLRYWLCCIYHATGCGPTNALSTPNTYPRRNATIAGNKLEQQFATFTHNQRLKTVCQNINLHRKNTTLRKSDDVLAVSVLAVPTPFSSNAFLSSGCVPEVPPPHDCVPVA